MDSPGVALPQTWMGMSRWRTMWLEKILGRETSAWVVRVTARRQRVRRNFIQGLRLLLYLGGECVDEAEEGKVSFISFKGGGKRVMCGNPLCRCGLSKRHAGVSPLRASR